MIDHLDLETKFDATTEGEIEGLAIVWDRPDNAGDVVERGAFRRTLRELKTAGRMPAMLWMHSPAEVIGRWTDIAETAEGLRVKGRLNLQTQRGAEARALLLDGSISGLSIGFRTKASQRRGRHRVLTDLDLVETSICSIPCAPDARVLSVKGATMDTETTTTDEATPLDLPPELLDRISALETKAEPLPDLAGRLYRIETRLARPGVARIEVREDRDEIEKKAFVNWARRGLEGLSDVEKKVLTATPVGSPATDGYQLVPEVFSRELLRNLVEISPMRQVARVQQVAGGPVLVPRRVSNLTAAWVAETVLHDVSEPTYDQLSVGVFEARVTTEVTNQLLEDSAFDLAAELARDFAEEFARLEGAAFVSGDGTTMPEGFLTSPLFVESGTALDADSIIDLYHAIPARYASRGTWLMNRAVIGSVRKLRSAADGPYIWADTIAAGQPPTLLGRPVLEMPGLAAAGASPDVVVAAFGDWSSAYRIFDRVGLEVLRDPYTKARYSIVCFHARKRVGGALVRGDAVRGITA